MLVHLGWPLLCERLAEHLRTPMARSLLQAEVAAELAQSSTSPTRRRCCGGRPSRRRCERCSPSRTGCRRSWRCRPR
ncbi:hypothetical protein [Nannocystis pusilla]|uniref:hypothetical protein n=1 Tax=Nannocystis pusilla TaxID=889268 RepID=UPI003B77ECF7